MISIGNLQINKLCLGDVEVTKAYLGDVQVYGLKPKPEGKYMTITVDDAAGETVIKPNVHGSLTNLNLQYRINNGDWTDFIVGTTADIHLTRGNFVQFKGNNTSGISTSSSNLIRFVISGNPVHLSGNVMSLIDGIGETTVIPNSYCFNRLFLSSNVKTVSKDFLPATTITEGCYFMMFDGCKSLVNAPELPATTLAKSCYNGMFGNCTNLVNAPELHATTIAGWCYYCMFNGCTSLTTAPALPATTLAEYCCFGMFQGCTSLVTAPELPATTLANGCYDVMFSDCTALTTAPELPATMLSERCYESMFSGCTALTQVPALHANTLANYCCFGMFQGCTSLVTAPELPAKTLAMKCYYSMFKDCTALTKAPSLPATTLASNCYDRMFYGCTALTTAPELPATTLTEYCYYIMFNKCSKLNYIKCLATDITADYALDNWLEGTSSTGTFVKTAGVSYPKGVSGIPYGWTVVEEKPKPEGKYMTMTVLDGDAGTTIKPTVNGSLKPKLQYRINSNGDWTNFIVGTTADIHLVSGDWVQFKGNNTSGLSNSSSNYLNFAVSGNPVALSGNVMSLIDGIGEKLVIPSDYCFSNLFSGSKVKTVSSDFLPATTLTYCCYKDMFGGCSILVQAPALPSTTLAQRCYYNMFRNCTSLKKAPELPATKLVMQCYEYMFFGCSSLNYVKCSARNITANSALDNWLQGVAQTGTFVKRSGVSYPSGSNGIPKGWTIQNF